MTPETEINFGTCGCGKPAEKISSGSPECWKCWNWRKLDGPAARHWAKVGAAFLSNVDMYDLMTYFKRAGLTEDEYRVMLDAARKLTDYSQAQIDLRG